MINFNPGTIGSDQTICEGTAPATFTGTAPSGDGVFTYTWENSADGITYVPIAGATSSTYTAPAIIADTWYKRIVTSTLNTHACSEETLPVKVTVNNFDPGSILADQTICEGDTPAPFTSVVPTGDGTFTYQWQSSLDGATFSNITGAINETYAAGALNVDTWYRRQVTSTLNAMTCTEVTVAIKVTVNNLTAGSIGSDQTICENDIPAAFTSVAAVTDGAVTYQWESSNDGTTFALVAGATSDTYSEAALAQDRWYKRIATSTIGASICTKESNTIKVTVNNFDPGSISTDQTICEGSAPSAITSVTPTGDGTFTYRWFSSADGITFVVIPGAINETYNPGTLIADRWYKREVTSSYIGKACVEETNVVRITVNNFDPGSISADQTICESLVPIAFASVIPTGDGVFTYQWKSSTDGVNYVNIAGATSETYAPAALTQDTWYIRAVTSTLNAMTCTEETNFVKVTVNNVNGGTIISDQTICNGSDPVPFSSVVHGTGDGVVTWQWQSSTDGVSFTDIAGANGLFYDSPVLTQDTWFKRITKSLLNTVECTKESNVVKVTVNEVYGGTITADQTICFGSTPAPLGSSDDGSGTGTVTYQWMRSDNNVIWNTISGATLTTYAPGIHYVDQYYKRMLISIQNGVLCTAESNVVKITVNPLPVAILSGGETICPGDNAVLKVSIFTGTGPFDVMLSDGTIINGYNSDDDIVVSPVSTTTYTITSVVDANGCSAANMSGSATVTVRALPAITTSPSNVTTCEFGLVNFTVAATGTDLTYQWYVNPGSGFVPLIDGGVYFGATNSTLSIFGATRLMNNFVYHAVVTTCANSVTSGDATLTVNTAPEIITQPHDSTICMGSDASFSVTAAGTAVTYQWQVNPGTGFVNVINDANFGGATTSTLTITNAPASFNNYIIRVILGGTCGAPVYSNFVVLRVNIPPVVTLNPVNKTACDGTGPVVFSANGSGFIDSLRWQVFSGGVWSDIHDNAIYSGSSSQQLTLTAVSLALNNNQYRLALKAKCVTIYTTGATLTVNANPVVDFSAVNPINACGGVPLVINGNPTGGSGIWASHLWTGDVGPLNNYFIQSPTFNSQIAGSFNLNYKVKDSNGCYGNGDVTVMVDVPDATFTQDINNGCTPFDVTFTKDMTGIAKYWWDFDDGSPLDSLNSNPVHTFTNVNPSAIEYHNVKLTVQSPGGCQEVIHLPDNRLSES